MTDVKTNEGTGLSGPEGPGSDDRRAMWNERYAQDELVWSAEPNRFLAAEIADLPPGRALDLGAGEGRNAIWLAQLGWQVTAIDFSDVAIAKGRSRADSMGLSIIWQVADLLEYRPDDSSFGLVILMYIHLPPAERRQVLRMASEALAPAGTLLVVGHDTDNISRGVGGPQNPSLLYSADDVLRDIGPFQIVRAGQVLRPVETDEGSRNAIDVLVRAVKPTP